MSRGVIFGPVDVERHRQLARAGTHLHVFYRGEDVTARCTFADDTPGQEHAICHQRDANGQPFYDPAIGAVATEVLTDGIEILTGDPLPGELADED